jgi:hypothetical protein
MASRSRPLTCSDIAGVKTILFNPFRRKLRSWFGDLAEQPHVLLGKVLGMLTAWTVVLIVEEETYAARKINQK